MSDILWRRLAYFLSPQADLYEAIAPHLIDKSVLEVGFGTGFGVLHYAGVADQVDAIEQDEEAVTFASRHFPLGGIRWINGNILDIDIDRTFDAVVMIEVLEHIGDWEKALRQVSKHLVRGGKLYLSARNANADLRKNKLHEREWTAVELKAALSKYFASVTLYDYKLANELDEDTHQTPLLAVATA